MGLVAGARVSEAIMWMHFSVTLRALMMLTQMTQIEFLLWLAYCECVAARIRLNVVYIFRDCSNELDDFFIHLSRP